MFVICVIFILLEFIFCNVGFPGGSVVKKKICLQMQELWVWSLLQEDPLKKDMTTHSSILAWRTPWTEKSGGLCPWCHKRVGHDLATEQQQILLTLSSSASPVYSPTYLIRSIYHCSFFPMVLSFWIILCLVRFIIVKFILEKAFWSPIS